MASKDDFKKFARVHPELVKYIKSGETTWQKLYEIYDIYGENESAWNGYLKTSDNNIKNDSIKSLTDKLKNIDFTSIQEHISTAQKALGIVEELAGKKSSVQSSATPNVTPRPINKIFED